MDGRAGMGASSRESQALPYAALEEKQLNNNHGDSSLTADIMQIISSLVTGRTNKPRMHRLLAQSE